MLTIIFGALGIAASVYLNLSPIPSLKRAYKTKDIKEISQAYLTIASLNFALWTLYGIKADLIEVFIGNLICFCLSTIWICTYHGIKGDWIIYIPIYIISMSSLLVVLYIFCPKLILGLLGIGATVLMYGAPIERIIPALKYKDYSYIDVWILTALIFNAASWIIYGVIVDDWLILAPNIAGLIFTIFQLILYLWARSLISCGLFTMISKKLNYKSLEDGENENDNN
ncbi:unnamed protein product [Blepharisma stoltei]|uniref:Sugar transporter SWEET n=1 Tax=Blepharisma stoltei TaxID=1481888 RepID=A0AAU9K1V6_9CILI|nr:unnamed protein product [Blepharisma stoltei]